MTLQQDILPYIDGNTLVSPHPVAPGEFSASENGVCFTSEYLMLEHHLKTPLENQLGRFWLAIDKCFKEPGLLMRTPINVHDQAPPDDQLALAAACVVTGYSQRAKDILSYGFRHFGSFNNVDGKWTLNSFLWRQPQLIAALYAGAGKRVPFLLALYSALAIVVSCRNVPPGETDPRRLAWLLIQALSPVSWMMRFAARGWYKRLYRDYGPSGMAAVRKIYYHGDANGSHPFVTYSYD